MTARSMKDWALYYADIGFAVFPLKVRSKYPATEHGFKDASKDKTIIEKWWNKNPDYNIGIATGQVSDRLIVIDLDIDNDKGINGYESLKDWERDNGSLPETWTSITGRGGYHLLYRCSIGGYQCKTGLYDGVDIRADGGYIVAPPSIHPDTGRVYEWEVGPEDEVDMMPVNSLVAEFLAGPIPKETDKPGLQVQEEILEGGRVDSLIRLIGSLRSKNLGCSAIELVVRDENDKKCKPPLTESELQREVFPALSRNWEATKPYNAVVDNGKTRPIKDRKKLNYQTAKDLLESDLPPVEYVVNTIIAKGLVVLSAKSKIGKSWFALQLAVAVASGRKFLGFNTKQGDVLYIDLENAPQVARSRLITVLDGAEPPDGLVLINDYSTMNDTFIEDLSEYLEEHKNTSLVIVDVFQRIKKQKKANQSDYEDIYQSFTPLKELASKYGIALVLIMHDRKMNDPTDPFNNVLGSTAIMGASDQMLVIQKKERKSVEATLSVTGRTVQENEYVLRFNKPLWTMMGDAEAIAEEKRREEYENNALVKTIRKLVGANGGRYVGSTTEIIEASKMLQGCRIYDNATKCGMNMKKIIPLLEQYDAIEHFTAPNGNASSRHEFKKIFV